MAGYPEGFDREGPFERKDPFDADEGSPLVREHRQEGRNWATQDSGYNVGMKQSIFFINVKQVKEGVNPKIDFDSQMRRTKAECLQEYHFTIIAFLRCTKLEETIMYQSGQSFHFEKCF